MDFVLLFLPCGGLTCFVVFNFTGGLAVAIYTSGGEDRSLIAYTGIGLVGWAAAGAVWHLVTSHWPRELTFGLGLLALVSSIVFVHLLEKRSAETSRSDL